MYDEIKRIFEEFYKPKGLKFERFRLEHKPKLIDPKGKVISESYVCYVFWFNYKGRGIPIDFYPDKDIKEKFETVFKDLQLDL